MGHLAGLLALLAAVASSCLVATRRPAAQQLSRSDDRAESGSRTLFVAGLEGSGHHFLEALWAKLQGAEGFNVQDVAIPARWGCPGEWIREAGYLDMVATFDGLQAGGLYMFPSQYSYPCGKASHEDRRDRFYPHINWISEAASETSTDFRVIFLYRPMEEVLAADCLHRKMEASCTLQAETLVNNADHLTAQIDAVRKKGHHGVQCMLYGDMPQTIGSVENALGTDFELGDAIRDLWRPSEAEALASKYDWWPKVVGTMRKANEKLAAACNAAPRISSSNFLEAFRYSGPLL